jgi:hypothetical protein
MMKGTDQVTILAEVPSRADLEAARARTESTLAPARDPDIELTESTAAERRHALAEAERAAEAEQAVTAAYLRSHPEFAAELDAESELEAGA